MFVLILGMVFLFCFVFILEQNYNSSLSLSSPSPYRPWLSYHYSRSHSDPVLYDLICVDDLMLIGLGEQEK